MNREWPSSEKPLEERVIEALKEKGRNDPEASELLQRWVEEEIKEAERENTPEANLRLSLKIARLFRDAGLGEEALIEFEAAYEHAYQERNEEVCEEIAQEIDALTKPDEPESGV